MQEKSYLSVKEQYKGKVKEIFEDANIKISTEDSVQLLEANNLVKIIFHLWSPKLCEEITELSLIAKTHPHAAHSAFTSGYKHKFTFFMRTIENTENFLLPALFNDYQISEE